MICTPRTCPICMKVVPIDHDFYFDKYMNLIHKDCKFKVFQDKIEIEKNIKIFNKLQNINK